MIDLASLANLPRKPPLLAANGIKFALWANRRRPPYLRHETLGRCGTPGVRNTEPWTPPSDQDSHFFQFSSSFSRERSQSTISPSSIFLFSSSDVFSWPPVNYKPVVFLFPGETAYPGSRGNGTNAQIAAIPEVLWEPRCA
jgi:hypothetical protein